MTTENGQLLLADVFSIKRIAEYLNFCDERGINRPLIPLVRPKL